MVLVPDAIVGGDFRLLRRLGDGGMGSVWLAEQTSVGRKRALKVMRSEIAHDPKLRERFLNEAKIGATIDSDHVVEVIAAGIDEARDIPWIAMELLEGRDLGAVIAERGPLPLPEVAELARQLGHALAAAHRVGIVHRDLKPENVFLARCRRSDAAPFDVKVLDFGIAKLAADARATGATSSPLGTPLYMTPEQTNASFDPTPALDVWALGLVVYRAITGRYFWRSSRDGSISIPALMREILIEPIPSAHTRATEDGVADLVPANGFDAWLARCLERDPRNRFADAGEACASLASIAGQTAERASTLTRRALRVSDVPEVAPTQVSLPSPVPPPRSTPIPSLPAIIERLCLVDELAIGRVSDLIVILWRRTPTLESVALLDRVLGRAVAEIGKPVVMMPVLHASNSAPEGDVRRALELTISRLDVAVTQVLYVVRGSGFQSAALRAVITALVLAVRPTHATKVFPTVADAIAWLSTRRGATWSGRPEPTALVDAIDRFCAG